ncbi:FG-GAP-like repeat-containing protein [Spirosoma endophyticum]|uniref:Repeat domain-containing protein n=1 Tax=Spirosoma endophyticum TaxID=662367 RepID=A0A1I2HAY6_9BACT|nr:FG-GAP-like repeat-containing protein [Spirosoma endophyticum]SFF27395.1 Repeat domain-containing protein [Spirosoma endophyticum]
MQRLSFLFKKPWFLLVLGLCIAVASCQSSTDSSTTEKDPTTAEGEKLAKQYCSTCHSLVAPDALDKETWRKHALPAMAPKLGVEVWQQTHYYHPPSATISQENWAKLVDYYEKLAPEKPIKATPPTPLVNDWSIFKLVKPAEIKTEIATTTMVTIDSTTGQIYTSKETDPALYKWSATLKPTQVRTLPSPAVQADFVDDGTGSHRAMLTCIGTMLAVDKPLGELLEIGLDKSTTSAPVTLSNQLPRPIQSTAGDFNKDGLSDWIVCGFGHNAGGLYLLKQRADHQFDKVVIKEVPGATQVITGDFNHDGWLDFMALFAHADEGIWLFTNDQQGGFTDRNLLRFPPVYGSTSFQLVDFNKDGRLDILYTCGDNSDYSRVLKPFHGVYIFINHGSNQYKQTYFYPINGCTKAVAGDFDRDGDLDIATIAFFGDLKNNPAETFIYFEQKKTLTFIPHALPVYTYGRWICMDVKDWDHDGDLDIALGNYSRGFLNEVGFTPTWNGFIPLIVLENSTSFLK